MNFNKQIEQYATDFWQQVIDDTRQSLKESGKWASGATGAAMDLEVSVSKNKYVARIIMPDYYKFLDEGVKGTRSSKRTTGRFSYKDKQPPLEAIRRFMLNRRIVGAKYHQTKKIKNKELKKRSIEQQLNSIAFAIAKSIKQEGLEQTNFYSDNVNAKTIAKFERGLAAGFSGYIIEIINKTNIQ